MRRWPAASVLLAVGVFVLGGCGGSGATRTIVQHTRTVVQQRRQIVRAGGGATSPSLQQLVAREQSGIVRIVADDCFGGDIGTGFELSPRIVATVEHVVDGASAIRLTQNGATVAQAKIIGADPAQDLALLLTNVPLRGYAFSLSDRLPQVGEGVAAIGFPFNLPLSVTQGTVSGLNRTVSIDGYARHNLIQTDAAVNPGNSGGPLLAISDGKVLGLVDLGAEQADGLGFAVSSTVALQEFSQWQQHRVPVRSIRCSTSPAALLPGSQVPPLLGLPPATTGTATTGTATTGTATTSGTATTGAATTGTATTGAATTGTATTGTATTGTTGTATTGTGTTGTGTTGTGTT